MGTPHAGRRLTPYEPGMSKYTDVRLVGVKFTVRPSVRLCRGDPAGPMPKSRVSQTTVFGAQRPMLRTLHD